MIVTPTNQLEGNHLTLQYQISDDAYLVISPIQKISTLPKSNKIKQNQTKQNKP
jgi:uncharacterized membrane-anchored protein